MRGNAGKGCSSQRHRSKSNACYINGKSSLAFVGFRSAFSVAVLKSKAKGSGEGYRQAAIVTAEQ